MAELIPFKEYYGVKLVKEIAASIRAVYPEFRSAGFIKRLEKELEPLELKGRISAIAAALHDFLPENYPDALKVIMNIIGPELQGESGAFTSGHHLFILGQFVESYGLEHPDLSLPALYEITKRSTSEMAIRPYILRYPTQTMKLLRRWARDRNLHVRRLVSEGTRTRLPWASQLRPFIDDPSPVLELLEMLKDDPSEYVRRSVANNLNDIGKDHPEILLETARRWSAGAGPERSWIIGRALRSLVKQGNSDALEILGFSGNDVVMNDLTLAPAIMRMNDVLSFSFTLRSNSSATQRLVIDYVMHFVKASGGRSPKVFKMTTCTLDAGGNISFSRRHAIRPITTRRYYPGVHRLEIQVNGVIVGGAEFELEMG